MRALHKGRLGFRARGVGRRPETHRRYGLSTGSRSLRSASIVGRIWLYAFNWGAVRHARATWSERETVVPSKWALTREKRWQGKDGDRRRAGDLHPHVRFSPLQREEPRIYGVVALSCPLIPLIPNCRSGCPGDARSRAEHAPIARRRWSPATIRDRPVLVHHTGQVGPAERLASAARYRRVPAIPSFPPSPSARTQSTDEPRSTASSRSTPRPMAVRRRHYRAPGRCRSPAVQAAPDRGRLLRSGLALSSTGDPPAVRRPPRALSDPRYRRKPATRRVGSAWSCWRRVIRDRRSERLGSTGHARWAIDLRDLS